MDHLVPLSCNREYDRLLAWTEPRHVGLPWGVRSCAGMKTEFGKTFEDMKEVESRRTPLQMKMDELGKQLSVLSFGIIGVIALVGVLQVSRSCSASSGG